MKTVRVALGERSYEILIGPGLLQETATHLERLGLGRRVVIIANPVVRRLYGEDLKQTLEASGLAVSLLEFPDGERFKTLATAGELFSGLAGCLAERGTPILALGGGVTGDLAGFVAATYQRGLPLLQLPTTLLAQVDAAIGGKVAVDHAGYKNMVGTFYQPRLVIADVATLATLPESELINGLAEVIKSAVIGDPGLFDYLENNMDIIKTGDTSALEEIIFRSVSVKAAIVARDETDRGVRSYLNLGHTVGHAIESVSGFGIKHGVAVAIGLVAAAQISEHMGILPASEFDRVKRLLISAGLPVQISGQRIGDIHAAMRHDKKVESGRSRFILPRRIGEVFSCDSVDPRLVERVLQEIS